MKDIKELLERYYNGETSLEEEQQINVYLKLHHEKVEGADVLLFGGITALKDHGEAKLSAKKSRNISLKYLAVGTSLAAGIALLILVAQGLFTTPKIAVAPNSASAQILVTPQKSGEIKDEQQALEQARKALAYVSSKLNKGTSGMGRLNQLEQSISKIQNKEKS